MSLATAMSATAATAKISASIDSTVVEMGSRATITLDIADPSKSGINIDLPAKDSSYGSIDVIRVDSSEFNGGMQYKILIQAFEPGTCTFPPFRYVVDGDTAESDYLTLKVLPVDLDSLETINPMESVVNPPRRWYDYVPDWTVWVLLAIAVLAAAICLVMLYRKNGGLVIHKPKPVDPYEAAMSDLSRLRERKLAETGHEKEYYTRLVDILRVYLERRFAINAMEMTTTQILQSLRKNPETRDNQARIKQILELADFVKFANVRPMPDDNIKTFNGVVNFVEDTKPLPPEPEEETKNKK